MSEQFGIKPTHPEKVWSGPNPQICFPWHVLGSKPAIKSGKRGHTGQPKLTTFPTWTLPATRTTNFRTKLRVGLVLVSLVSSEFSKLIHEQWTGGENEEGQKEEGEREKEDKETERERKAKRVQRREGK
jgi:hypothetical protein